MTTAFLIVTLLFVIISVSMVLIILVQRPSGGGLAGAFGGAGGGSSDTVFGGRVGDALTWATVVAFVLYLGTAITLNKIESANTTPAAAVEPGQLNIESPDLQQPTGTLDLGNIPGLPPNVRPVDPSEVPAHIREAAENNPSGQPE